MRKYFSLWGSFYSNSLTRDMEYKANLISGVLVDIAFYSVHFFFFTVIYSYVDTLGIFTREDIFIFLIITFLMDTVYMFLFSGNLFPLNQLVVKGDLDFLLLKPVNSQFLVSFRYVRSYAIISLLILIGLLIRQSISHPGEITFVNASFFLLSFCFGLIIWYSIDFIIACLTFWFRQFSVGGWLSHEVMKFSMRPDSIYTGFLRKVLFSFIPMALVSSIPARILLYGPDLFYLSIQIVIAVIFLSSTMIIWKRGLMRYESASS